MIKKTDFTEKIITVIISLLTFASIISTFISKQIETNVKISNLENQITSLNEKINQIENRR